MYLTQPIQRNAQTKANKVATLYEGRSRTWSEIAERVAKFAGALQKQGLKNGDRVAILSLNSDRCFESFFAIPWAGGVLVPLNIRWSVAENIYSLEDSGASILIVDDAFKSVGQEIVNRMDGIKTLIYSGDSDTPEGMLNYEEILEKADKADDAMRGYEDLAGIFYTGGTTGFPKGVMLSHQGIWASSMSNLAEIAFGVRDAIFLHASPMFHIGDFSMTVSNTIAGTSHAFIPAFDPQKMVDAIAEYKVTDTLIVPTMVSMLLASPALDNGDISSLQYIIYGASPMPEGTLRAAMEKMPHVGFYNGYGQTELAPTISILRPEYHTLEGPKAGRLGSAGRAVSCVEIKIVGPDGTALPTGEVGEVAVRGPNAMKGYWNRPEQTEATLVNGWVMTGDAGYLDEEGFLFLVDRVKDMIISGGENVFSAEVENAISMHPAVHEVVVIGIPSDQWGESVHAIIRVKPGAEVTEQDIVNHCHELIAGYKCPRSVEFREDPFPITAAGKLRKVDLRKPFWEGRKQGIN